MKIGIILQARMGSTRLPGKTLKEVLGRPLLLYEIERLKRVQTAQTIILATTTKLIDDVLATFASGQGIHFFRGSEDNVLERFYLTAKAHSLDVIARVTADCPLIDPAIIDQAIRIFLDSKPPVDYLSNILERTYPRGMDVEVFSFDALEKSYKQAKTSVEREHVTPYIYLHPDQFKLGNFTFVENLSDHRWTVDTPEDFRLIEKLLSSLYPLNTHFSMRDVLNLLKLHPDWIDINKHVEQKKLTD